MEEILVQYKTKGMWLQISKIYILLSLSLPLLSLHMHRIHLERWFRRKSLNLRRIEAWGPQVSLRKFAQTPHKLPQVDSHSPSQGEDLGFSKASRPLDLPTRLRARREKSLQNMGPSALGSPPGGLRPLNSFPRLPSSCPKCLLSSRRSLRAWCSSPGCSANCCLL